MKILGIACSPRPKGNSTILLQSALESLAARSNETELVSLRNLKFNNCTGCEKCSATGVCIFKDDLVELFKKIEDADKVIVAAPVFSMGINALGKGMVDRAQMYWARKYVLKNTDEKKPQQGMLISTAGMNFKGIHDCSRKTIKYFYNMLDIKYKTDFVVTEVDAPGEILEMPEKFVQLEEIIKDF